MYKVRQDMKLFDEGIILSESEGIEYVHEGKVYTISSVAMKDYRTEDHYSHLTVIFTVLFEGKRVDAEFKYDTGYAEGKDVKDVINMIRNSSGRKSHITTSNLFGMEFPTLVLTSAPSINELLDTYFWLILSLLEKEKES